MNPLFEFLEDDSTFDPTVWFLSKVVIARYLLGERADIERASTAAEIVNETLIRIRDQRRHYDRQLSKTGVLEDLDAYVLRCMKRTVGGYRAKQRLSTRQRIHDESVRLTLHREPAEATQERGVLFQQAQRKLSDMVGSTKAGKHLRDHADNALEWGEQGLENHEIAARQGVSVALVDKNRSRLAALIDAKLAAAEVSK